VPLWRQARLSADGLDTSRCTSDAARPSPHTAGCATPPSWACLQAVGGGGHGVGRDRGQGGVKGMSAEEQGRRRGCAWLAGGAGWGGRGTVQQQCRQQPVAVATRAGKLGTPPGWQRPWHQPKQSGRDP
jgi:hypothetical protein